MRRLFFRALQGGGRHRARKKGGAALVCISAQFRDDGPICANVLTLRANPKCQRPVTRHGYQSLAMPRCATRRSQA